MSDLAVFNARKQNLIRFNFALVYLHNFFTCSNNSAFRRFLLNSNLPFHFLEVLQRNNEKLRIFLFFHVVFECTNSLRVTPHVK